MKYLVIEIQKQTDGTIAKIVTVHDTLNEALSKYHTVLSFAAVSTLPKHSCCIIDEGGYYVRNECFEHEIEQQEGTTDEGNN
jgi:hypothetical protein